MFFSLANETGKAMMSQLLTAKSAGFKVVRIDYTITTSGSCVASALHIQ